MELKVSLEEEPAIGAVVQSLVTEGGRILSLKKVEPTLEDVFIELVGHGIADEERLRRPHKLSSGLCGRGGVFDAPNANRSVAKPPPRPPTQIGLDAVLREEMPSHFRLFTDAALARTYPRVAWLFRSRSWMIQETILPVLAVAAFAYAYRAMNAPQAYTGFVVLARP